VLGETLEEVQHQIDIRSPYCELKKTTGCLTTDHDRAGLLQQAASGVLAGAAEMKRLTMTFEGPDANPNHPFRYRDPLPQESQEQHWPYHRPVRGQVEPAAGEPPRVTAGQTPVVTKDSPAFSAVDSRDVSCRRRLS
jgi:hypothetical protein